MTKKKDDNPLDSVAPDELGATAGTDLEMLRGILFGNQAKAANRRLDDLQTRAETSHHELTTLINEKVAALSNQGAGDLSETRKELTARIDQNHKELTDGIAKLSTELQAQLRTAQKDVNDRLSKFNAEQTERTRSAQIEARQQNDELREELLTLTAWLDDKKTARQDLGVMLAEIGERLQNNDLPSKADPR